MTRNELIDKLVIKFSVPHKFEIDKLCRVQLLKYIEERYPKLFKDMKKFFSRIEKINYYPIKAKIEAFKLGYLPKCTCGNYLKWNAHQHQFNKFCSSSCSNKSKKTIEARNNNNTKKYGTAYAPANAYIEYKQLLEVLNNNKLSVITKNNITEFHSVIKLFTTSYSIEPIKNRCWERYFLKFLYIKNKKLAQWYVNLNWSPTIRFKLAMGQVKRNICICGKPTTNTYTEFRNYCGPKCAHSDTKYTSRVHTEEARSKRIKSMKKYVKNNKNIFIGKLKTGMINKYGVSNPSQLRSVQVKKLESGIQSREHILGNRKVLVQGYEGYALTYIVQNNLAKPNQIIVSADGNVPVVEYTYNGIKCKYFPDFYIPNQHRLVEVKSTYTLLTDFSKNKQKARTCLKLGYKYNLILIGKNGKRIRIPKFWYRLSQQEMVKLLIKQ